MLGLNYEFSGYTFLMWFEQNSTIYPTRASVWLSGIICGTDSGNTYSDLQGMCRLLSANLVEITSKEESDFIGRFLSGHCKSESMWHRWFHSVTVCVCVGRNSLHYKIHAKKRSLMTWSRDCLAWPVPWSSAAISTWIGATDIFSEGKFVWMPEGEPVNFTNWAPGEPNHNTGTGSEDCVILDENRSWHWNDIACTTAAYFVCEMRYGACASFCTKCQVR